MKPSPLIVLVGDPTLPDAAKPEGVFIPEDLEAIERLRDALHESDGPAFEIVTDHTTLIDRLRNDPPAGVLNFCDTGYRNVARHELHVPALLELLGVPYSGAGPACLGACYDKGLVRAVAASVGVPVPAEASVPAGAETPFVMGELWPGAFPVLVKPNTGDGSEGITASSVARDEDEAAAVVARLGAQFPDRDQLIQEFLPGREMAVGLVGNPGDFTVLPPLEVDYSGLDPDLPKLLAYESKTVPDSPYWNQIRYRPAELEGELRARMVGWAERLFARLGCRDYARFDFRCDARGEPRLLEVNPNPAWCWDGKMNLMAGFAGWSYADFLDRIRTAFRRRLDRGS